MVILFTCVHKTTDRGSFSSPVPEMKLQTSRCSFCSPVCMNLHPKWNYRQTEDHLCAWTCIRNKTTEDHSVHLCAWTCIRNETTDKQKIILLTCLHKRVSEMVHLLCSAACLDTEIHLGALDHEQKDTRGAQGRKRATRLSLAWVSWETRSRVSWTDFA